MPKYSIDIPLDASAIEDFKPDAPVKVLVRMSRPVPNRKLSSSTEKGMGSASFSFDDRARRIAA